MHNKTSHRLAILSLAISFAMVLAIGFMLNFPLKAWEITNLNENGRLDVMGDEFTVGDNVPVYMEFCKTVQVPGELSIQFQNDIIYTLTPKFGDSEVGCRSNVSGSAVVPNGLPLGEYHIKYIWKHRVNIFRTVTEVAETESFNIK